MVNIFTDCIYENGIRINIKEIDDDMEAFYHNLDERYHFSGKDIYFFHNSICAIIFLSMFPYLQNSVLVYHQQGTLSKEYEYFAGSIDIESKKQLDTVFRASIYGVEILAFPSYGAIESVCCSDEEYRELIENKKKAVLYNGCDLEEIDERAENILGKEELKELDMFDGMKFISVADLNEAKGVERIPEYLYEIKKTYGRIKWVIIGNGVKADELLENIFKYELQNDVIWSRNKITHQNLLRFLLKTDFYIMAHRTSIFDFATIEAMECSNIPVLTKVGGNIDFIQDENGVFINGDDLSDITMFKDFISKYSINDLKNQNREIANKRFSQEAFIKGYAELTADIAAQLKKYNS